MNIYQSEALVRWIADLKGIEQETLGVKGKRGVVLHSQARFLDESDGNLASPEKAREPCPAFSAGSNASTGGKDGTT